MCHLRELRWVKSSVVVFSEWSYEGKPNGLLAQ